jgi:hypothetical protein
MMRQLQRLTRPVPAAGPGALAIAVYAEPSDGRFVVRSAADQGFEGVACLDDAARAAGLYCQIWQRHRFPWALDTAKGLLRFVGYLQSDDGRFANFIFNWDGQKNLRGSSSVLGGRAWSARAMHALALAVATIGGAEYEQCFRRGLPWLDHPLPYLDVRAVEALAALEYWSATDDHSVRTHALAWAEEIAAHRIDDLLPDAPGNPSVHIWGHLQEAALARVGQAFGRPDLVEAARASVEVVFVPCVKRAFTAPTTLPFDVSCAVLGLSAVAEATGQSRYADLADQARAWFDGRTAARRRIYNRQRGLVYDGIDNGRVNRNSGAESNLEGALALLDSLPWKLYKGLWEREARLERAS